MDYNEAVEAAKSHGVTIFRINEYGIGHTGKYEIFGKIEHEAYTVSGVVIDKEFFYFGKDDNLDFLKQQFATFLTNAMNQDTKELIMTSIFKLAGDVFKYLSAEMMSQDKPVTMTIKRIDMEEITNERGKDKKAVLYFNETSRGMVLGNKTNFRNLIEATGTMEVEEMIGKKVRLRVEPYTAFGKSGLTIRIDPKPVRAAKPKQATAKAEDIPQNGTESEPMPLFEDIASAGAYSD